MASPCINVCRMGDVSGLCLGCFRTLDEISGWNLATEDDKSAIFAAINRRRAEHDPCGEEFRGDCDR
ncbi:DUF1289 domain-containing protein [Propionivibrio sp.]|uniref:DUF1289 domain-containing protein n=1 Tax=Propionivibrio sp. TaxID=2212460 RepID=UPI003BF2BF87